MFTKKLDFSFLSPYRYLLAPFGPVGFVVAARTYLRKVDPECICPDPCNATVHGLERYWETIRRCVEGVAEYGAFTKDELETLYHYWFMLKSCGGGRHWWQLGTEAVKKIGADSLQNCWFVSLKSLNAFTFMLNQLMLGGGVGFSVRAEHIFKLPPVKFNPRIYRKDEVDVDFIVPDNREGWVELLERVLNSFFVSGKNFTYSTHCLRAQGKKIKTFGGTASGGEILVQGIEKIIKVLRGAVGRQLKDIEGLDIANIIGWIVVAGNVRRSSEIAIGDRFSKDFLNAKRWDLGIVPNWRSNSNNSIECSKIRELPEEFWEYYNGEGEPVGLVNIENMRRFGRLSDGANDLTDPYIEGCNPCGEISLESFESCFIGETLVDTPEGVKLIKDLVGDAEVLSMLPDDKNLNNRDECFRQATVFSTGIKLCFEMKTSRRTVTCSRNHPFLTLNKGWSRVEVGDHVLNRDNEWELINEILPVGEFEVFNMEVEDSKNYIADGLIVHNCNLSEIFLPNVTDPEFFTAAELMVKVCKTISTIPHSYTETRQVVDRNHRLGVGVTGFLQAPDKHRAQLFDQVYRRMRDVDVTYSQLLGVTPSIKITTVKPSGTLSLLPGVTPGIHPAIAQYYIRRIQFSVEDALVVTLKEHGYWTEPKLNLDGTRDPRSVVVEFPCATPAGTVIEDELSAVDQLNYQKWLQTWWADNNVSCTIKYAAHELPSIRQWLEENYDTSVKTTSFLLRGDASGFKQMPFEAISKDEYNAMILQITPVTDISSGGTIDGLECNMGGTCPVR